MKMKIMIMMSLGLADDNSIVMLMIMMSRMKINLDGHESDIYTSSRRYENKKQDSRKSQRNRAIVGKAA